MFERKKKLDVIAQKEEKLAILTRASDTAIRLVRTTIDSLESVNEGIQATIDEIDADQKRLSDTRSGLETDLHKNQQIMQNFKSLLCVE